tara:strand:- start:315 stop:431 length:117 start_codon:yes stop_codon:yes gene_type:complete
VHGSAIAAEGARWACFFLLVCAALVVLGAGNKENGKYR